MVDTGLVTLGALCIGFGVNTWALVFWRAGTFEAEHQEKNRRIVDKMLAEFEAEVRSWKRQSGDPNVVSTRSPGQAPPTWMADLQRLSKMGGLVEKWIQNIRTGKQALRRAGLAVFLGGVTAGIGILGYAYDIPDPGSLAQMMGLFALFGFGVFVWSIKQTMELGDEIDRRAVNLDMGKDAIEEADLKEAKAAK